MSRETFEPLPDTEDLEIFDDAEELADWNSAPRRRHKQSEYYYIAMHPALKWFLVACTVLVSVWIFMTFIGWLIALAMLSSTGAFGTS